MADAEAAARDVALSMVRAYLDKSRENCREGVALIDRANSLRGAAFDLLPVGVRLAFDPELWGCVVEKGPDGWSSIGDTPIAHVEDEWVRENWDCGNWEIVEEEPRG